LPGRVFQLILQLFFHCRISSKFPMIKKIAYILIMLPFIGLIYEEAFSQNRTISGFVEDSQTGERLINANIYNSNTSKGTVSNTYGFFSLTLPAGNINLTVSYVGYEAFQKDMTPAEDTMIIIALKPALEIDEVTVIGSKAERMLKSSRMGLVTLPVKTIKTLPVLLGETDALKAMQLFPGIQSGTEGSSALYIRGGGPDQNLILIDGVPVYNPNHLFGFISMFNTDVIKDISITKGGFPARYGGRLSSVVDIRIKEGNTREMKGNGSIGLISTKLILEGPLVKDKVSFLFSGRRSYLDVLKKPVKKFDNAIPDYFFHDFTGKLSYKLSGKSNIFLSYYLNRDKGKGDDEVKADTDEDYTYKRKETSDYGWNTDILALHGNYIISKNLFFHGGISYQKYKAFSNNSQVEKKTDLNTDSVEITKYFAGYHNSINDVTAGIDFDFMPSSNHAIKFGVNYILHGHNPDVNAYTVHSQDSTIIGNTGINRQQISATETGLYIEDDFSIGNVIKSNIGLRFSGFFVEDQWYLSLEPRISARFLVSPKWSLKVAYSKMRQHVHLLSSAKIGLTTDLLVPTTSRIKPQTSEQFTIGTEIALNEAVNVSLEGYYKLMNNLIAYKEGASYMNENNWENLVEEGKGRSFGVELLVEKTKGKTTGWLGYTLSRSERQFENISFGKVFPFRYDRTHDISLVIIHRFSGKTDAALTWVYGTGNAVTFWTEIFFGIDYFEHRNNIRMPAYHRLDLSLNRHKKKKWGEQTWSFGIYNAYNRINPFYLKYEYDPFRPRIIKVGLFPFLPSVTYSLKF
jgi:hypothetical protein